MPIGSSICMVSVHVHAIRLDRAIITPGSYSRPAMALYSSHHPGGTEGCRKASLPSRVDRQSEVLTGKRAAPNTDRGRYLLAKTCSASSTSLGTLRPCMASVNSLRTGVIGSECSSPCGAMDAPSRNVKAASEPGASPRPPVSGETWTSTVVRALPASAPALEPTPAWRWPPRVAPRALRCPRTTLARAVARCHLGDRQSHDRHAIEAAIAGTVQKARAFSLGCD